MYKLYPNARRAHLKTGGNFPYLCRSAEVNLYIQVSSWIPSMNVFSHKNSRRKLLLSLLLFLNFPVCSVLLIPKGQGWQQLCPCWASFGGFLYLNSCVSEPWFHPHKSCSEAMFLFYQDTVLLQLFLCYSPCPTDPFAAVPWYPLRSHWSLHGQCRRAGSPKDQPSHQHWARRAVSLGVPVKQRHWFGGLPVYNQLLPLRLFPCVSRLSLCDSNRINSRWATHGQQPPAVMG